MDQFLFKLVYLLNIKIIQTARVAPDKFAKISNKSPFLVVVNSACAISIAIPKKMESINDITKGLKTFELFNCFLKNKNQSNVNTK